MLKNYFIYIYMIKTLIKLLRHKSTFYLEYYIFHNEHYCKLSKKEIPKESENFYRTNNGNSRLDN